MNRSQNSGDCGIVGGVSWVGATVGVGSTLKSQPLRVHSAELVVCINPHCAHGVCYRLLQHGGTAYGVYEATTSSSLNFHFGYLQCVRLFAGC